MGNLNEGTSASWRSDCGRIKEDENIDFQIGAEKGRGVTGLLSM